MSYAKKALLNFVKLIFYVNVFSLIISIIQKSWPIPSYAAALKKSQFLVFGRFIQQFPPFSAMKSGERNKR